MSAPVVLPHTHVELFRLIQAFLLTDTDPTVGLLAGLGAGADSVYPNFTTSGPDKDRAVCPTPFVIVVSGGMRAVDRAAREVKTFLEIHDDPDHGDQRWPGLVERLIHWLLIAPGYRPQDDTVGTETRYLTGVYFEEQSPPNLPDGRYDTQVVQLLLVARAMNRTSNRGYNG